MGVLTTAGKNLALDALRGTAPANHITHISLHSADPGATGANNEISGGSPAYARQSITWSAASGGNLDSSNTPEFNVPADTTVSHWAAWSASTGGTCYAVGALSASEPFVAQGTYTLTDADITLTDPV
jgi:hypothetical protein